MSRISLRKVGLLTVLYLVQGLPFGFFLFTFPLHLRAQGMSLGKITFISIVNFPWLIKFLWAPLADKYYWPRWGRRRSWIIPAQLGLCASLLVTGFLTPQLELLGLMALLSVVNFFAATQDIGVDGLAVDILDDHERGVGNSVQVAAYKIGMLGGGYGLTFIMRDVGIQGCFYVMAGAVALAMLVPLLLREPPPPSMVTEAAEKKERVSILKLIWQLFQRDAAWAFLLFVLLVKAGDSIANPLFRLFLKDQKVSLLDINNIMNLSGMLATLIGSAVCGTVILWIGRRPVLWLTVVGQGLSHLVWAFMAATGTPTGLLWAAAITEHFVSGMLTVVVFTLMMDAVRPEAGSGQYSLLSSIYLGTGFGLGLVAGYIAQYAGYQAAFAIAGGTTLCCVLLLGILQSHDYLTGKRPELAT